MYDALCPTCGVKNNLTEADLGVRLKCGSCGEPFVFGAEIRALHEKQRKLRKEEERALAIREKKKAELAERAEQEKALAVLQKKPAEQRVERVLPKDEISTPPAAAVASHPVHLEHIRRRNIYPLLVVGLLGVIAVGVTAPLLSGMFAHVETPFEHETKALSAHLKEFGSLLEGSLSFNQLAERIRAATVAFDKFKIACSPDQRTLDCYHKAEAALDAIHETNNPFLEFMTERDDSPRKSDLRLLYILAFSKAHSAIDLATEALDKKGT